MSGAILDLCIEHGGSITGEHGVGVGQGEVHAEDVHRRRPRHHAAAALRLRPATHLSNPGKVFPTPRLCGEVPGPAQGRAPAAGGRAGGGVLRCRRADPVLDDLAQGRRRPRAVRGRRGDAVAGVPARLRRARRPRPTRSPRCCGWPRGTTCASSPAARGTTLHWGAPPDARSTWSSTRTRLDRRRRARRRRPGRRASEAGTPLGRAAGRGWPRPASSSRSTRRCPARPSAARWPPTRSGPRRLLYGTARDLLIGVTVVPRRRRRRQGRRQGRQERRRLRPRQAAHRLATARSASSPRRCSGCTRCRPRRRAVATVCRDAAAAAARGRCAVLGSQLVPGRRRARRAGRRPGGGRRAARGRRAGVAGAHRARPLDLLGGDATEPAEPPAGFGPPAVRRRRHRR